MKNLSNTNLDATVTTAAGSFVAENIVVQKKLAVGAVNDPLEHEADAMADRVMRMPMSSAFSSTQNNSIQRKCNHCEEEENDGIAQRKPLVSFIQKKENNQVNRTADDA